MSNITPHPHWKLVEELENTNIPICLDAAQLIRELKQELRQAEDKYSRLRWPDETGL